MKKQVNVVGAVILDQGRIYCVQRGPGGTLPGKWEFPGGKIELGETEPDALVREITEELLCEIEVGERIEVTSYEYDFAVVNLTTYYAKLVTGAPELTEHSEERWVLPDDLDSLDWAEADIPAVRTIMKDLSA